MSSWYERAVVRRPVVGAVALGTLGVLGYGWSATTSDDGAFAPGAERREVPLVGAFALPALPPTTAELLETAAAEVRAGAPDTVVSIRQVEGRSRFGPVSPRAVDGGAGDVVPPVATPPGDGGSIATEPAPVGLPPGLVPEAPAPVGPAPEELVPGDLPVPDLPVPDGSVPDVPGLLPPPLEGLADELVEALPDEVGEAPSDVLVALPVAPVVDLVERGTELVTAPFLGAAPAAETAPTGGGLLPVPGLSG